MRIKRAVASLAALCVAVAGCSIVQPNVEVGRPTISAGQLPSVKFQEAIDYANAYIDAYKTATQEHGTFNLVSTAVLVPLTAFTAARAIVHPGNAHQIAALAIGAAGGYELASLVGSSKITDAYSVGRSGMACLVNAVEPANLPEEEVRNFAGDASELRDALAGLGRALVADNPQGTAADKAAGLAALTTGQTTLAQATALALFIYTAPNRVMTAVDGIAAKVDSSIITASIDYQQYRAVLNNVMPAAVKTALTPPGQTPPPAPQQLTKFFAHRLTGQTLQPSPGEKDIPGWTQLVQQYVADLNAILNNVNIDTIKNALDAC